MPRFAHGEPAVDAPLLVITESEMLLDGQHMEDTVNLLAMLKRKREQWSSFHPHQAFPGIVQIEASRELNFSRIKRAIDAAAHAGYIHIGFIGIQVSTE